jgi:hypothetical protein
LVTKVSTRPTDCDTCSFLAFFGTSVAKVAGVPRQRLGLPSSSQLADSEHAAELAGGRVLRLHDGAVRGGDDQVVQAQRHVVEVEQVVGHGRIDGDPRLLAGDDGLRGLQPGFVGQGGERKCGGQGGG